MEENLEMSMGAMLNEPPGGLPERNVIRREPENLVHFNLGVSPEIFFKIKILKDRLGCKDEGEVLIRGIIALDMCTQEGAQLLVSEEAADRTT